jgi:hypothetical protein
MSDDNLIAFLLNLEHTFQSNICWIYRVFAQPGTHFSVEYLLDME